MGLKVQIRFTGLCAFIPDRPIEERDNEATVILVNSRRSPHDSHHALVFAEPDYYPDANYRPHQFEFNYEKGYNVFARVRALFLGGEALTLVGRDAHGNRIEPERNALEFAYGYYYPPCPDSSQQSQQDIGWVAENPGTIDPRVLTANDRNDLIAVRMKLTQGKLKCGGFRQVDRGLVRWKFGEGDTKALAEEVLYELEFADERVVGAMIESTPFVNQPRHRDLLLTPRQDINLIELWIVDMPLPGLIGADERRPFDEDHHYHEFYRLCQGNPPNTIPVPDVNSFCTPYSNVSNPKCPPTLFSPLTTELLALEGPQPPFVEAPSRHHCP